MHACMHALFVFVHEVSSKQYLKIKLFYIPLAGIPLTYDDLDYEDKINFSTKDVHGYGDSW